MDLEASERRSAGNERSSRFLAQRSQSLSSQPETKLEFLADPADNAHQLVLAGGVLRRH